MSENNKTNTKAKKGLFVQSYGCQMNVYDSERMVDVLAPLGYAPVEKPEDADLVVLNTCHIREKATEKVYSEIGRLKMQKEAKQKAGNGDMMIAVAGCVAQAEGAEIMNRAPVVELVVGPQAYHHLPELIARAARKSGEVLDTSFDAIDKFDALPIKRENTGVSAFLSVQEGCDKFCSFCVVPYTRGEEFSRPFAKVMDEAKSLVDNGVKEIILLGQNVNAYDGGNNIGLAQLIEKIAELNGVERIRYTTSHPCDMRDDLIAAHGSIAKLMPYLHLPVQAGSNKVLKAMNRKHTVESYAETIAQVRKMRPDIAIASDFIVGFPGESDKDFEETMALVREIKYASAYSFKYSRRPGTPASAMMYQIAENIKDERLQALQALLAEQQTAFNASKIGQEVDVLVTGKGRNPGQMLGKAPWQQSVFFAGDESMINKTVRVKAVGAGLNSLAGELLKADANA
ncbi:tRNA (N6-isopentenyl adenosine(37)-C2)-methylthiotransferase MiaB [Pseudaquidulcibacter saccharophilus]|uniref:tRNA (N6-isopentenyl adenosine(37)-C2)-methylthiotransferase MiaB n=1 Tax=Pseudaquidulcibacter saccharophilus TaxID=2831900 RepID=UPI001EFF3A17|nr:tRNA (N6-isopentenyl adenosine(37)-C2)-methylthiotransferase MiaB [Pseudaquidulcibacter saccharophilus]